MSNGPVPYVTAAVTAIGVLGGAYYAYRLYCQENKKIKIPENWTKVGTLKAINAYPIKSCAPVMLEKAECSILGLKDGWLRDRVVMVIDEKNNFVTARAFPELLTVQPTIRSSILTVKHAQMEPLHVNLAEVAALQKSKTAYVWGVPVPVYDCGFEASEWFSRFLDSSAANYRLAYYASQSCREQRVTANKFYNFTPKDMGALPDELSFNMINEASVEDLNTRLNENCRVTTRNFRPNFVVEGAEPYAEDGWKFVKIGENVFEVIKPCTRCVMTTVDPETGVRNSASEPLNTLKKYRQIENEEERRSSGSSPRMGVQLALRSKPGGTVSLNDPIYVA